MNDYDTAAYAALHDTANTLGALLRNACSSTHPWKPADALLQQITAAQQALFAAQRSMERSAREER